MVLEHGEAGGGVELLVVDREQLSFSFFDSFKHVAA